MMRQPKALVFDLQGTVVDFHAPIMRLGGQINAEKRLAIDWAALLTRWRGLYRVTMDAVIAGERDWLRVDEIYRLALDALLDELGLGDRFAPAEREAINAVWTRLDPWPDSVAGLSRLRAKYTLATLSNAGMAAAIALVKHAALPFDAVLTAELARSYKPAPAVYRLAVDYLGFPAADIMMVACHAYDLAAARTFGMQTAFVARPLEFGPSASADPTQGDAFDVDVGDLVELAARLGT